MRALQKNRWYLLGSLVLGLLIILVIWFSGMLASSESQSNQLLAFSPDNCSLPCVMGVVPGETSWEQALLTVSSLVPSNQMINEQEFGVRDPITGSQLFITLQREDPRVGDFAKSIELRTRGSSSITTLGVLLDKGYTPDRVFRARVSGPNTVPLLLTFKNTSHLVVFITGYGEVNRESPVDVLVVLAEQSQYVLRDIIMTRHFENEIDWIGFASVEKYWQLPSK
jgi:hypothetical protein